MDNIKIPKFKYDNNYNNSIQYQQAESTAKWSITETALTHTKIM